MRAHGLELYILNLFWKVYVDPSRCSGCGAQVSVECGLAADKKSCATGCCMFSAKRAATGQSERSAGELHIQVARPIAMLMLCVSELTKAQAG